MGGSKAINELAELGFRFVVALVKCLNYYNF
ncbi:hypothetical protein DUPY_42740 [Duganella phyllosphaerae]|uniref:Uncharacterized protein n=1 Tax=Duganella phyllosphaerae TaxID=762836 RepID=A0A1E7WCX4_9BURK|nr:hypothetical protein DUPY_42740 [Duganella phyllosphaerae]